MAKDVVQEFDSMVKWIDFLRTPVTSELSNASEMPTQKRWQDDGWPYEDVLTETLDEAIDLAEKGWEEGVKKIIDLSASLSDEIISILHVPEVHYNVTGDQLDVGRYVAGEPEDFMTLVPAEIEDRPKILHLVANVCASAGVKGDTMIRKGAAVVALVDALEKHGKRLSVDVASLSSLSGRWGYGGSSGRNTVVKIRVKETWEPVNLANLVMCLAHPSTLRRLMFRTWEHMSDEDRNAGGFYQGGGYGYVEEIKKDEDKGDIYIEGMDTRRRTWRTDEAIPWLLSKLSEQGIHAEKEEER